MIAFLNQRRILRTRGMRATKQHTYLRGANSKR
jgi:hypothetical protein